jgi:putative transposase
MFRLWLELLPRAFRARRDLLIENLALRQQLAVLKRKHPRPRLTAFDRSFWLLASRFWSSWKGSLILVSPDTVVRWHRAGFRWYWSMLTKIRENRGRKRISKDIRGLIFRMAAENPSWDAPRIHGELLMLGFDVSERTVSRWMRRSPSKSASAQVWRTFLRNHSEAISAMDFFTVPTWTFGILYCFFVISHDRRRILHFNVTRHPTSIWISQQVREAFPFAASPRFLLLDHDANYGFEVQATIRSLGIVPVRTSIGCPWQNGIAERWVGSCRREILDHVIALNERHLRRLLSEYISYYHEDRTHIGLGKRTPGGRTPALRQGKLIASPRLGGLHHRYGRVA